MGQSESISNDEMNCELSVAAQRSERASVPSERCGSAVSGDFPPFSQLPRTLEM